MIVGTAPVNWNNDDLEDWRTTVPYEVMLDEMAAAGYAGTEYGGMFPNDPEILRRDLGSRNLALAGSYQWLHLRDRSRLKDELIHVDKTLAVLEALGCSDLVVADAMTPERVRIAGRVAADGSDSMGAADWHAFVQGLELTAELATVRGYRVHYHNHVGTFVETPAEVAQFLTKAEGLPVDLCFDTGHYAYGGGDPTAFVLEHRDRIGYLHLKDVDGAVLSEAKARGWSFLDALRRFIFSDFGKGVVDIPKVIGTMRDIGYGGWIIVEQDTCRGEPLSVATANREYLRSECGI